ncbi:NADH dehydrogenase subunit E [Albidovulum inexpectatum]|uniref:NADH dehydrogenase subunit E n=1 Tax=Albidovulum inexpectatum TaxID=196587 RepID=A0A2S5JKB3_9RHOB|nr:NADH-quinone oxidoreductase subunit E [Albidovulum inexpectatum]PPB81818.1 NADH dehydrogenase subunit E [Albidovulum inexpectatum]
MLRRLHPVQPESFEFTPANLEWARAQISKYPEGRQASAIIPLLWRAQEQEGWLTRPAIEYVADMLGMPYIRALEVATFYFMFQLQPVGSVAHIQICGTTSCMICGAEDLIRVCKEKIAPTPHTLSADGKFSWEEVECLGACANAPMAQIGKDYYEDLTADRLAEIIDELAAGKVPVPGPQNGRYASEPKSGLTTLKDHAEGRAPYNASVQRAVDLGDTVKRIDGTEVPILTPWLGKGGTASRPERPEPGAQKNEPKPAKGKPVDETGVTVQQARAESVAKPELSDGVVGTRPPALEGPRDGRPDDLKQIKGVGPKLEELLHSLGIWHFDQIASWSEAELAWVDDHLDGFRGRATRDRWIEQARILAEGGETEFSKRVEEGDVY